MTYVENKQMNDRPN